MVNKLSAKPCPICREMMWVIGHNDKGQKLTSCGHKFKFKQTRSQKDMGRKYIRTEYGLELSTNETNVEDSKDK